jgi:hypothetical protein
VAGFWGAGANKATTGFWSVVGRLRLRSFPTLLVVAATSKEEEEDDDDTLIEVQDGSFATIAEFANPWSDDC